MQSQITFRLPVVLADKLERKARSMKRKRSDVVRQALEQFLDARENVRPIERVRDLLGSVDTGISDLGWNHREHMFRGLRRGRSVKRNPG